MSPTFAAYFFIIVGLALVGFRRRWAEHVARSQGKLWGRWGTTDTAMLRFLAVVLGAFFVLLGVATLLWPVAQGADGCPPAC